MTRGRLRHAPLAALFALAVTMLAAGPGHAQTSLPLHTIKLPPGFKIEVFARVPGARSLVVMEDWGVVLTSTRGPNIHAAIDTDRDGRADKVVTVKSGLKLANGIAWKDGFLYVAEQHRLTRYPAPDLETLIAAEPEVLFDGLPDRSWHGWRYAAFGPDGALYVSVGAPCNVCAVKGLEGTIQRFRAPGWKPETYASGVRNPVGLAFHPETGHLYFTDNGADNMGDDSPPEEFNHAPKQGLWFGYPWYGGGTDRTLNFKGQPLPREATPPAVTFGAHIAPLGIGFYTGAKFPAEYRGDAFVAHHGSWNRSVPDGYRVARVRFDKITKKAVGWEPFATGWLESNGVAWGRPVDVKQTRDGALLVSDDRTGTIYRIRHD